MILVTPPRAFHGTIASDRFESCAVQDAHSPFEVTEEKIEFAALETLFTFSLDLMPFDSSLPMGLQSIIDDRSCKRN